MNMVKLRLVALSCLCYSATYSQPTHESICDDMLAKGVAGVSIPQQSVVRYGVERCFISEPIDEVTFGRIKGLSYKDNCSVPLEDLRHLRVLHYNANEGITMGEIICNYKISDDLLYIFRELFNAEYPIESVRLVDEYLADDNLSMINNNSSSFNFRYISGTTHLSKHSLGLAIDINPLYNPYVKKVGDKLIVDPLEARGYVDRGGDFPYKIDSSDLCYKLFIQRGFEWGGDWSSVKDYQHFEKDCD